MKYIESEVVELKSVLTEDVKLEINIIPGNEKPYYLKEKDLKHSRIYTRYGRNKLQTPPEEIKRMIIEHLKINYLCSL